MLAASWSIGIERAPAMWPAAYSAAGRTSTTTTSPAASRSRQLAAADLLEPVTVAEVGGGELVELLVVGGGDVAQRRPQFADALGGEPVVDPGAVAAGRDQTGRGEDPEMERGVGDALADLGGELLDVTFALGEHVDQLGSAPVAERLGDLGERVEQRILRLLGHPSHDSSPELFKELLDNVARPRTIFKTFLRSGAMVRNPDVRRRGPRPLVVPRSTSATAPPRSSTRPASRPNTRRLADAQGCGIAWTIDTHSHADYVTGSPALAAQSGVDVHRPGRIAARDAASAGRATRSCVELGARRRRCGRSATPGHTPDHHVYRRSSTTGHPWRCSPAVR